VLLSTANTTRRPGPVPAGTCGLREANPKGLSAFQLCMLLRVAGGRVRRHEELDNWDWSGESGRGKL